MTVSNGCSLTILKSVEVTQHSGSFKWGVNRQIYPKSANFELTCHFMLCFTEGLFVLHTKDLNRQVEEQNNEDKGKSQRQTNSDKCEQLKGEIQETETQTKWDAKDANPMVMGNNNSKSIAPLSEVLINQNSIAGTETKDDATIDLHINYKSIDCIAESVTHHSPFSIEEGEDDMPIIDMQFNYDFVDHFADLFTHNNSFVIEEEAKDMATQNSIITNNNNEGLIVDVGKQNQTVQKKKGK